MSEPTTPALPVPREAGRLVAVSGLDAQQLELARLLAIEGTREHTIRRALQLTPSQWKQLKQDTDEGDLSPLALALEEGRAEGAGEIISFMKTKMKDDRDVRAAEWLAANIFQINKGDGNTEAPRVFIQINAALSPEEYARVINANK